ncbi:hypothetical protein HOLleu_25889 [Holothuria leucospilota]|uniref:Uncharacterized protein n=1 Tax=Holothuria leucospilota TaxID=206669 RepID=A0A9Q1BTI2_HOLLE|nr:hypothetical protein HOLleu_25889 [Holothuria leucospilota]
MELEHPKLDKLIFIPMTRRDQLDADRIFSVLERILQSNDQFTLDEGLVIKIIRVEPFEGGKPTPSVFDDWIKEKKKHRSN